MRDGLACFRPNKVIHALRLQKGASCQFHLLSQSKRVCIGQLGEPMRGDPKCRYYFGVLGSDTKKADTLF